MKKRVLVICDVPDWAFHRNYLGINKYCINYDIEPTFVDRPIWHTVNFDKYDVILNQCDYMSNIISKIPKSKHILCIRSHLYMGHYTNNNLINQAAIIAVANEKLMEVFKPFHNKVVMAPGGVDTLEFFPNRNSLKHNPPVVGWAGTNYSPKLRGTVLIQEACKHLGFIYKPAYREDKWRTIPEMVKYYQNDIDIYVDASETAGRQNGLFEAGACGKALVATNAGMTKQLITDGENGVIIENRHIGSICSAISKANDNYDKYSVNIRKTIEDNWSWRIQAKIFETMFGEICQ